MTATDPTPFELLRRHEAAQKAIDQDVSQAAALLDSLHAAYLAGHAAGYAAGQLAASIDLARAWSLELAHDAERLAVDTARARHGDGWADTIARQTHPPLRLRGSAA